MPPSSFDNNPRQILPARILVVDDERQIHASLRLRLGEAHELVFAFDGPEALEKIRGNRFDLCLVDLHMPGMDGFALIDASQDIDPALGFVVLSAFDSPENLRRAIPLQVYDFLSKPLPPRESLEGRLPEWIGRTRQRRHDLELARQAGEIAEDRDAARLERDVELVASEMARDVLQQAAGLLTTIQAHLLTSLGQLGPRARTDPVVSLVLRGLEEARKTTDAVISITAGFFDSGYASRDTSPAVVDEGLRHAIGIAQRLSQAEAENKAVDFTPLAGGQSIRGLSGIDFLLMLTPAVAAALVSTAPNTTVGIQSGQVGRLDAVFRDTRLKNFFWLNRRHALGSQPAITITVSASAPALTAAAVESWLEGRFEPLQTIVPRGLVLGVRKCRGLLGAAVSPHAGRFALSLVLPV